VYKKVVLCLSYVSRTRPLISTLLHEFALLSEIFWLPSFDHDGIKGVDLEMHATLRPAARFVQDHFSPSRFLLPPGVKLQFAQLFGRIQNVNEAGRQKDKNKEAIRLTRKERRIGISNFLISNTSPVTAFLDLSCGKDDFNDAVSAVIGSCEIEYE
jgi:hypothetical protein